MRGRDVENVKKESLINVIGVLKLKFRYFNSIKSIQSNKKKNLPVSILLNGNNSLVASPFIQ